MADVIFHQKEKRGNVPVSTLAALVVACMHEDVVFVDDGAGVRWHFTFPGNEASFDLYKPKMYDSGEYDIDMTLRVNGKSEWHFAKEKIWMADIRKVLEKCYSQGFPRKKRLAYKWGSSSKGSNDISDPPVSVRTDMTLSPFQKKIIATMADSLCESAITVTAPGNGSIDLTFSKDKPFFHIMQLGQGTDDACNFVVEMVRDNNMVWRLNVVNDSFNTFEGLMKSYSKYGFELDGETYKWNSVKKGVNNVAKFQDVIVEADAVASEHPEVVDIARAITIGLAEPKSKVRENGKNAFWIQFVSTYTYVKLVNVRWSEAKGYAFQLYMMKNDEIVYQYSTAGMTLGDIEAFFNKRLKEGFKSGDHGTFMWDGASAGTTKVPHPQGVEWQGENAGDAETVSIIADCVKRSLGVDTISVVSDNSHNWSFSFENRRAFFLLHDGGTRAGYRQVFFLKLCFNDREMANFTFYLDEVERLGRDLKKAAKEGFRTFDGETYSWKTDSIVEDEVEPEPSDAPVAQVGVVPDGITSIRAVALKYDGKVIAFRFKTDKGTFDMSKEAATQYGLSGFKSEKFVSLKSVNGILMSEAELQKNVLIPDVSENEVDCRKLISTIFRLR